MLRREERRLAEAHLQHVFIGPAVSRDYPAVERHCVPRPCPRPSPSPGERGVVGVVVKGAQVRVQGKSKNVARNGADDGAGLRAPFDSSQQLGHVEELARV